MNPQQDAQRKLLKTSLSRKWRCQMKTQCRSAIQVRFPLGLTPIDTLCQLKTT